MFDLLTTNNEAIVKAAQRYLSYLCLTIILTWIPTNEDRFKAVNHQPPLAPTFQENKEIVLDINYGILRFIHVFRRQVQHRRK